MFTLAEIASATGGRALGNLKASVTGVSTDSRSVAAGELFVPLRGERFDGHRFIAAAASAGVSVFLVEEGWAASHSLPPGASAVAVSDTLRALGDLAAFHRRRFRLPLVGITGSNGKTTTKEMLAAILSLTGPGIATQGNLNNLIGLPQMLFRLREEHGWGVLEMGMSEFGEIDRLAQIAAPAAGVVTNVFPAHLESMGTVEGVARAKGEMFLRLSAGDTAVYNADDPLVAALPVPTGVKRLSFGMEKADVSPLRLQEAGREGQRFILQILSHQVPVFLHAFGRHSLYNALAAAAAAHAVGISATVIAEGLEAFRPYDKRFRVEEVGGITLIDDSYNANPASVRAALETVRTLREETEAVAVIGDMLELGPGSAAAHREIGRLAARCVDRLYLLGEMVKETAAGAKEGGMDAAAVVLADDHPTIVQELRRTLRGGELVLVKGSRGMRMEKVAEAIRAGAAGKGNA